MLPLALTFVLLSTNPSGAPSVVPKGKGNLGPDVSAVLLGAGLGIVAGAALGVGTAFAVVYGSNNNGCYVGGCDAPLLSAIGLSVVTGTAGALFGATAGGVIGWSLSAE